MIDPKSVVSFQRAKAGAGPALYLSAAFSEDLRTQDQYFPRNRLFQYVLQNQTWLAHDLTQYIVALCTTESKQDKTEILVSLSELGDLFYKHGQTASHEKLNFADPYSGEESTFTSPTHLEEIGSTLYACGFDGKLVRREKKNVWRLLTPQFTTNWRQKHLEEMAELEKPEFSWTDFLNADDGKRWILDSRKAFNKVVGLSEEDIYVTGHAGGLLFWNGHEPRWIEPTPKVSLFGMYVEPPNVWVCGSQGTILHGNAHDGFEDYSLGTDHSFNKITRFKGKIYLSANGGFGGPIGLFTYDGRNLRQVTTGLTPDIHDIHTVTAADGILWAVGYRDILCFDGQSWRRIDHPDNPPVR